MTPYLIHVLGIEAFGLWSLVLVFLATLTTLDGGIGASLARFFAAYASHDDRAESARLLVGSLLVFIVIGIVVSCAALALAPVVVTHLRMASSLRTQAVQLLHRLGLLVALALVGQSAVSLLQANDCFLALAGVTFISSATYAVGILLFVRAGGRLTVLVAITGARYAVLIVGGLLVGSRHLRPERPLLPGARVRRRGSWRPCSCRVHPSRLSHGVSAPASFARSADPVWRPGTRSCRPCSIWP